LIAVTGATGELGGRIARQLSERGEPIRMIVRDPARAPQLNRAEVAVAAGYHDTDEMAAALNGAKTMFMVSGGESPTRLDARRRTRRSCWAGSTTGRRSTSARAGWGGRSCATTSTSTSSPSSRRRRD
jgi:uncharacterized protein YbjT (DUF2867 family)